MRVPRRFIQDIRVIAFFAAIAVAMTWPVGNFAQLRLPASDDAMFSVWRIAWVAHQIKGDPAHLFDANIFYPTTNTLAYSDAMLLLGASAAPLVWAGVHPVAVHNALLLLAFVAAAYAGFVFCRHVTNDVPASLLGACVFAFAPYRFAHIGHLELLWTAFIPIAVITCYRFLAKPGVRTGGLFGVIIALQGLVSVYYVVFLCIFLVFVVLVSPFHAHVTWNKKLVIGGISAALVSAALLTPYLAAYGRAWQQIPARPEAEIRRYSAEVDDYFRVPTENETYPTQWRDTQEERSLFPGLVAIFLSCSAVLYRPSRWAAAYGVLAVVAFDLSLGYNGISYPYFVSWIVPIAGLRSPARIAVFVLFSLSLLVAIRAASFRRPLRRFYVPVIGALAVVMFVEYWSSPIDVREVPLRPDAFYSWLERQPRTVVLELPLPPPAALWRFETTFQFLSIYHWQPLVNGYSGNAPDQYFRTLEIMQDFPSGKAVQHIQSLGVDLLVLHERFLGAKRFGDFVETCKASPHLEDPMLFPNRMFGRIAACVVTRSER